MLFNKARPQSEALQAQLADLEQNQLPAARDTVSSAALAVANGDNPQVYDTARTKLRDLLDKAEQLTFAIPAAQRREAEEAETARSEEELRIAEAKKRADQALYKGAQTDLANWRRAFAPVPDACATLAVAFANARSAAGSYSAKIPDNAPIDSTFWNFGDEMFSARIAGELARAGAVRDVTLPGAGPLPDDKFAETLKSITDDLAAFARRVILDGERAPEPGPVIGASYPAPKPYKPAWTEIIREKVVPGEALVANVDPRSGAHDFLSDADLEEQRLGRVLFTIHHPAEGDPPAPPQPRREMSEAERGELRARLLTVDPNGQPVLREDWEAIFDAAMAGAPTSPEPPVSIP